MSTSYPQHDRDVRSFMARKLTGKSTQEIENLIDMAESGEHGADTPMREAISTEGRRILRERRIAQGLRLAPDGAGLPVRIRAFACQKCAGL